MTLKQWEAEHANARVRPLQEGCEAMAVYPNREDQTDLFHLDDYCVSSVNGGPWLCLVPRGFGHLE